MAILFPGLGVPGAGWRDVTWVLVWNDDSAAYSRLFRMFFLFVPTLFGKTHIFSLAYGGRHHNDCFVADDHDAGTYLDRFRGWQRKIPELKAYVAQTGRFAPVSRLDTSRIRSESRWLGTGGGSAA